MGVSGLHSYIENKGFLRIKDFRQSKLIIDGSSLYHHLYLVSALDQKHGGDYNDFELRVTMFFKNLSVCNIEPYVVFDGGADVRGNKFATLKKRYEERIKSANKLSRGNSGGILPILIKIVFKQVLQKLRIPFIQCLGEADWEVAALANEWNCPVLSGDSDFYIFNNQGGFLPVTHFQWRNVSHHKSSDKYSIPAKFFGFRNLCVPFNNMNVELLPLFATILGNDYSKLNKHSFPDFSQFSPRRGRRGQIDGLLTWLSRFPGPNEAIAALVSLIGKNKKSDDLNTQIYEEMELYRLKPSSISQFFTRGEPQTKPPGSLLNLPDWTLKPLAEGRLASRIIAVLSQQRVMLKIQVEDFGRSSGNNTSRVIRQMMYGMLLCTTLQKVSECGTSTAETQVYVEEYDRQETTLISCMVPAVIPKCVETQLPLDSLWEAPQHLRLQVMLEALNMSTVTNLEHIPEGLQLAVYVTCFWLEHAKPKPKAEIFWALLACLVYGHLCREQQQEKEIGPVGLEFKRLLICKDSLLKPVDLELSHAYSQWQFCLNDTFNLNQLLNNPLPEPELAWLYCGSLVHGVARELKRGKNPESFLAGDPVAIGLYQNLQAAVEYEPDKKFIKGMRTQPTEHQESMDELSKGFKHLMYEKEEENDNQSEE